jgi:dipeptidase D
MKDVLNGLKPEAVFRNFETLTRIPRGSGNEKAVSDYLVQFAKDLKLEVIQDPSMNVIIKKPATKGYESSKSVILQGHMDIVTVKSDELEFDFEKDPIPLVVDGDYIRTSGTTLGADNGIAVAMAMAILEANDLEHPELTVLITVEEETGMGGVLNLEQGLIKGDILINIDSEEEGIFLASCAGGVRNAVSLPIEWVEFDVNNEVYEISMTGLLGGHSGIEINKNRANAIKLLGRLLYLLDEKFDIAIASVSGGEKMNAIAKVAKAVVAVSPDKRDAFIAQIEALNALFIKEYQVADPNINITVKQMDLPQQVLSEETKRKFISLLCLLPCGVQTMSGNIEGLVESSNNVGVLEMNEQHILINNATRSSVRSLKQEISNRIQMICEIIGANMKLVSDYPEWEYKLDSPIRELMLKVYKEMYNQEAEVKAIHAGLECGFLKEKVGDIDMISLGPNMYDVHTPNEHLSISSTKRVYEFLCEVLKQVNQLD